MTWEKLPAWTGSVHIGCLNCSPMHTNTPHCRLDRVLGVGFGDVTVTKDGQTLYSEVQHEQAYNAACRKVAEALEDCGLDERTYEARFPQLLDDMGVVDADLPTLATYEAQAAADPDHDWRVTFFAPLHEEEYQRQGPGTWVLVRSGPGFA